MIIKLTLGQYTCYPGNFLCPVIDTVPTLKCGRDCYLPGSYSYVKVWLMDHELLIDGAGATTIIWGLQPIKLRAIRPPFNVKGLQRRSISAPLRMRITSTPTAMLTLKP